MDLSNDDFSQCEPVQVRWLGKEVVCHPTIDISTYDNVPTEASTKHCWFRKCGVGKTK